MSNPVNSSALIEAAIDDRTKPYAYAFARRSGPYSHLEVHVWLSSKDWWRRPESYLVISCQSGNDSSIGGTMPPTYAYRWGFSSYSNCVPGSEINVISSVGKKIVKELSAMEDQLGVAKTFAEYATRILTVLKVKTLISEHTVYSSGGRMADKLMTFVPGAGHDELQRMEKGLN